jgi:hypothetical protein
MTSREHRITLAILLAYVVFYLCGSSWLSSGWDKSFIRFLKRKNGSEFLWWPLLSRRLSEKDKQSPR